MKKPLIFVMGANPAWQKTLTFGKFTPSAVNRAVKEENYPSGKGVNFCRALRCSGLAEMKLFQFAGGENGRKLCAGLDAAGFPHETVVTGGETRNCITCLDASGRMTELIGVSQAVTADEERELLTGLDASLPRADLFAVTGSLPDGSDPDLCRKAAALAVKHGLPVLIDAVTGALPVLELPGKIILKVNKEEFLRITGCSDAETAHRFAGEKYPGRIFAITDGAGKAALSDGETLWTYTLPRIDVVSPLGAGDTASAVTAALFAGGMAPEEAFRQALAAASANCLNATAGEFSREAWCALARQITVMSRKIR